MVRSVFLFHHFQHALYSQAVTRWLWQLQAHFIHNNVQGSWENNSHKHGIETLPFVLTASTYVTCPVTVTRGMSRSHRLHAHLGQKDRLELPPRGPTPLPLKGFHFQQSLPVVCNSGRSHTAFDKIAQTACSPFPSCPSPVDNFPLKNVATRMEQHSW